MPNLLNRLREGACPGVASSCPCDRPQRDSGSRWGHSWPSHLSI